MKKTIWTTDHRTLEHYREMSSMPFSVDPVSYTHLLARKMER